MCSARIGILAACMFVNSMYYLHVHVHICTVDVMYCMFVNECVIFTVCLLYV